MITIHIPNGTLPPNLGNEIMSARNIKERTTRVSTLDGLRKISHYL